MKQRIITGIIFGIIVLALLLFFNEGRLVLIALIPLLASIEYLRITKAKIFEYFLFVTFVGVVYLLIQYLKIDLQFLIILCCTTNLFLLVNLFYNPPFIKHGVLKSIYAALYISIPFLLAFYLNLHSENSFALISIMILIWVSDSSAYFVGSRIGRRKLFPSISPKKTWEGFYGAGMCTLIGAYVIASITQVNSLNFWILFALIIWVLGSLGDLIASHVKRIHGVKDSGSILPGHGGFFDRFDAFIYVLPFILLLLELKK